MSGTHPAVDPVELAKKASQHELKTQVQHQEMALARSNSSTAHQLADGVKEYKGAKIVEHQKEAMDETLPHISKMAVTHNIKAAGRIEDMERASMNADTAHQLADGVKEYKGAKIVEHQKEAMDETLPHISKMAVTHNIKAAGRIEDMERASMNADTAHQLADGVKEFKGAKVEAETKQHKAELVKEIEKE